MLKTTGSPEKSTFKKLKIGDGEIIGFGIDCNGGKPFYYWIMTGSSKILIPKALGLTTMKLLVVVVIIHWIEKLSKSKKSLALKHAFIFLSLAFTDLWIETEQPIF